MYAAAIATVCGNLAKNGGGDEHIAHMYHDTYISWLQTLAASYFIIKEKETWPPIVSFSVSVYCSFA